MRIVCAIILVIMYLAILVQLIRVDIEGETLNGVTWVLGASPFFGILIYIALCV